MLQPSPEYRPEWKIIARLIIYRKENESEKLYAHLLQKNAQEFEIADFSISGGLTECICSIPSRGTQEKDRLALQNFARAELKRPPPHDAKEKRKVKIEWDYTREIWEI